ncbi:phosphotransferase [Candidatus Poribacteria bacterium]|jgi:Ser/Thr protein kinase RdoA (MazF antagonist)|nr:phosphotransferase [Candidatus Poribacteria bacterium]MBT5711424.1 phosphotransferase [Candidatus Poribacteria bacterium]MBT7100829.1 phosphotransferase [Candidatus Poribacteria bacterium]MBT7804411.1 phosphotransferase [Candidatus Poribacteria bacterium]
MTSPHFPAVWSVLAADALAEQVLPRYALDCAATCEFFKSGLNDTYRVRDRSASYYLRVYVHGWRELHDIEAEVELLNHLHAHRLSVSHPIATRDGDYILPLRACEGIRYAVLFSRARGRMSEETDHRSYVYGRLAGQIHVCADRLPHTLERFHIDHELLLDSPLRAVQRLLAHRPRDYDYLSDIAGQLKARVDELLPKELPEYGICHGDLNRTNVHFRDDDTPTVFDFDCFGYGWRAYDLAVFGWQAGDFGWSKAAKANRTRRWNLFLKGYEECRALSADEHAAAKIFPPIRQIWNMGLYATKSARMGHDGRVDETFDWSIQSIRTWIDYYSVL